METGLAYSALGVRPGAPLPLVRSAYRDRLRQHHPDTGDGNLAALSFVRSAYRSIAAEPAVRPVAPPAASDRRATSIDVYA
jgi:curved DNA-binding protein CbpA